MGEFKLIAIKTGNSLTKKESGIVSREDWVINEKVDYLKNLKPNKTFLFFNDYQVSADSKTLTNDTKKSIPNIYQLRNNSNLSIEVSAIVGRNGSGKSSLIEILYLAIHNLAVELKILYDSDKNLVVKPQNYLKCELFILIDEQTSYKLKLHYDNDKQSCELYKSKKENNYFIYNDFPDDLVKNELSNLFYAISVNYSVYGLNSLQIGNWINHLFHKNDSYQTPLVINPMREKGNFDINKENYLFKYRLLSNSILKYKFSKGDIEVTDSIMIKELIFRFDSAKIDYLEIETQSWKGIYGTPKIRGIQELIDNFKNTYKKKDIINLSIKFILNTKYQSSSSIEFINEVELYIVKKLYRIAFNYKKYWKYLDFGANDVPTIFETNFKSSNFIDYLKALSKDATHITLKLKQALNYILNNPLRTRKIDEYNYGAWFDSDYTGKFYKISFNDYANIFLDYSTNIIELLPPSLFSITINVSKKNEKDYYNINYLSSGQLQLIQSVQSSIYHLINLESYKDSIDRIPKYKNALIIFDEIELYFHPEYQRKIISQFLWELDQIKLEFIKNIHIVYITHSPFLLSDIPHTNQLHIKDGDAQEVSGKTFAANIYELLQNSFYMESPIGAHAENQLNKILQKLNNIINLKDPVMVEELKGEFIENGYLDVIKLIGDRIVRNKLLNMYFSCFGKDASTRKDFLENQIRKIQSELKDLDND